MRRRSPSSPAAATSPVTQAALRAFEIVLLKEIGLLRGRSASRRRRAGRSILIAALPRPRRCRVVEAKDEAGLRGSTLARLQAAARLRRSVPSPGRRTAHRWPS
jgi:hypothetical protein